MDYSEIVETLVAHTGLQEAEVWSVVNGLSGLRLLLNNNCGHAKIFRSVEEALAERTPPQVDTTVTAGNFDLFHAGHVKFLRMAADCGSYLIVLLCSDRYVRQIKGQLYPIYDQDARIVLVASQPVVDEIIVIDSYDDFASIAPGLRCSRFVKGSDWSFDAAKAQALSFGHPEMLSWFEERLRIVPRDGSSTSETIREIAARYGHLEP